MAEILTLPVARMPSPENEAAGEIRLLAAIGTGDHAALRELYARYRAALFSLALRFTGDQGAAEEILQDTFVKIWRHAASFDARLSRPFTWAVTIVRRTAIDYLRKHRRDPALSALPPDGLAPAGFVAPENPRASAEAHESAERVRAILAAIEPPRRDALELALFSTLTHAEIAARLAQPAGTVKTWIRRGLLELRAALTSPTP